MSKNVKWAGVLTVAVITGLSGAAAQASIVQVEAESGSLGASLASQTQAGALGGSVIASTSGSNTENVATWSIQFNEAGEFDLYVRIYTHSSAGNDSFYVAPSFGTNAASVNDQAGWLNLNGWTPWNSAFNGIVTVDGQVWQSVGGTIATDAPIWVNLSANFGENMLSNPKVEVPTYNVAAPGEFTFQIAGREASLKIDALAFVLSSERDNVTVNSNGGLSLVPEPASLTLVAAGGLLALRRRR